MKFDQKITLLTRICVFVSCMAFIEGAIASKCELQEVCTAQCHRATAMSSEDSEWAPVQWRGDDDDDKVFLRMPLPVLDLEIPRGSTVRVVLTEARSDYDVSARLVSHGQPVDEDPGVQMRRKPGSREVSFRFRRRTRNGEQIVIVARPPMRRGPRQRIVVRVR